MPGPESFPRTTSAHIEVASIDEQVSELERRLRSHPELTLLYPQLVAALLRRARFLAKLDDYGRAVEAAESYIAAIPEHKDPYLVRARLRANLHRFDLALSDLEKARELGASEDELAEIRAPIDHARGDIDKALAVRSAALKARASSENLILTAVLYQAQGKTKLAESTFRLALENFSSISAVQMSWMCFQWGRMYEEAGELARARYLYEIAYSRFPRYGEAAGHLAELLAKAGNEERARKILRELVTNTDDPEYMGQLAEIQKKMGDRAGTGELVKQATSRYNELLARFPEAFADHAARYFLAVGNDPTRAFELAQGNLAVRKSAPAYTLALEAALRADQADAACSIAEPATRSSYPSKRLLFLSWRAFRACGNNDQAAALGRQLNLGDGSALAPTP